MNADDFTHDIKDRARRVAALLRDLSPYERAIVLHEAQFIYDSERAANAGDKWLLEREAREDVLALQGAWISQKIEHLSPEVRHSVVVLVEGLANNAKLERLVGDDFDV